MRLYWVVWCSFNTNCSLLECLLLASQALLATIFYTRVWMGLLCPCSACVKLVASVWKEAASFFGGELTIALTPPSRLPETLAQSSWIGLSKFGWDWWCQIQKLSEDILVILLKDLRVNHQQPLSTDRIFSVCPQMVLLRDAPCGPGWWEAAGPPAAADGAAGAGAHRRGPEHRSTNVLSGRGGGCEAEDFHTALQRGQHHGRLSWSLCTA